MILLFEYNYIYNYGYRPMVSYRAIKSYSHRNDRISKHIIKTHWIHYTLSDKKRIQKDQALLETDSQDS